MKNKVFCLLFILLFLVGCGKVESNETVAKEKEVKVKETIPTYQDKNDTPISFYELKGSTLIKVNEINGDFNSLDDILFLQIYPSNLDTVSLNSDFSNSFYEEYMKYQQKNPIKIGFSLTYTLNGENIHYNILTPSNTMDHWEQFMAYLYDDYANRGKGFYSHIEPEQYTDSTLFTAIKLQCGGNSRDIADTIYFSVFTYDSEDDFLDGKYRGNSISTISLCLKGSC